MPLPPRQHTRKGDHSLTQRRQAPALPSRRSMAFDASDVRYRLHSRLAVSADLGDACCELRLHELVARRSRRRRDQRSRTSRTPRIPGSSSTRCAREQRARPLSASAARTARAASGGTARRRTRRAPFDERGEAEQQLVGMAAAAGVRGVGVDQRQPRERRVPPADESRRAPSALQTPLAPRSPDSGEECPRAIVATRRSKNSFVACSRASRLAAHVRVEDVA